MLVEHELACGGTACSQTETVHDVVETGFEELEEHLAGDAFGARRLFKEVAELTLEHTVCVFSFLLFAKLGAVLGSFLPTVGTMLARRIVLLSQHFVIAKYWLAELTGDFSFWSCVSCHFIYSFLQILTPAP